MPPTALRAPRGERRGLLVLTVGAGAVLLRALPHRPGGLVPMCLNARGSSCSFRASPRGTGRFDDYEADGHNSAARRRGELTHARGSLRLSRAIEARRRLNTRRAAGSRTETHPHGPSDPRYAYLTRSHD